MRTPETNRLRRDGPARWLLPRNRFLKIGAALPGFSR